MLRETRDLAPRQPRRSADPADVALPRRAGVGRTCSIDVGALEQGLDHRRPRLTHRGEKVNAEEKDQAENQNTHALS